MPNLFLGPCIYPAICRPVRRGFARAVGPVLSLLPMQDAIQYVRACATGGRSSRVHAAGGGSRGPTSLTAYGFVRTRATAMPTGAGNYQENGRQVGPIASRAAFAPQGRQERLSNSRWIAGALGPPDPGRVRVFVHSCLQQSIRGSCLRGRRCKNCLQIVAV